MNIKSKSTHLAAVLAGALMLCVASSANAIPMINTPFELTFTDLSEQKFPCDVNNPSQCDPDGGEATRIAIVTNNSGVDWTDFHFRVMSDADEIVFPPTLLANPNNFDVMADGVELWLFGPVANGEQFTVTFVLQPANGPVTSLPAFMLFGTPSIPEPGTLALFGLGLAGLVAARRRKTA